jgi:replicative DNA helicase
MSEPASLESERGLLGIIITRNETLYEVSQSIVAGDFFEPVNGELYNLLKDLIEAGRQVTAATLVHDAQDAPIWGDLRASEYIHRLEREAPPSVVIAGLARTIRELSRRRRLIALGRELQTMATDAPVSISADELRAKADEAVAAIFTDAADMGLRRMSEIGDGVLARLQRAGTSNTSLGLGLPLTMMQNLTGPLMPGRVYVIAGGPGSGKSALALQIGEWIAEVGGSALLFSIEMDDEEQVERSLSTATGVKAMNIERALVDDREFEQLWDVNEKRRRHNLFIDGSSNLSMAAIRGRAVRLKKLVGLDAVIIDHIHYVAKSDKRLPEFDALDENLKAAKRMAKDLGIPVIVLSLLSTEAGRDLAKWPHRRPHQGDLLYAGIVERHADVILLVHRREYFLKRNEPAAEDRHRDEWLSACGVETGRAELILTKRRGGIGFGRSVLGFEGDRFRFADQAQTMAQKALAEATEGFLPGMGVG